LKPAERDRKRRRDALLLSVFAETPPRFAGRLAEPVGVERPAVLLERGDHRVAELVDLFLGDAELRGCLHLAAAELLSDFEPEGEITRRDDVRAAARGRKLVNVELRDGGIGCLATRAGAREEREVRPDAANGTRPPGALEHL